MFLFHWVLLICSRFFYPVEWTSFCLTKCVTSEFESLLTWPRRYLFQLFWVRLDFCCRFVGFSVEKHGIFACLLFVVSSFCYLPPKQRFLWRSPLRLHLRASLINLDLKITHADHQVDANYRYVVLRCMDVEKSVRFVECQDLWISSTTWVKRKFSLHAL